MTPLHPLLGILRTSSNTSLHRYSSQSEIGETSKKDCRKEEEKQRCLKHKKANVIVSNVASMSLSQEKTKIPQKTGDCLDNLCVNKTNMDGAPKAILEQILCIRKVNAIHPIFVK